jgi:hypothetical protein
MVVARTTGAVALKRWTQSSQKQCMRFFLWTALVFPLAISSAQQAPQERAFPQSKTAIQTAIRQMESSLSGRLPILAGFATSDHPLESYRHGYYQSSVQVSATATGGSLVRVTTKITAWYVDPGASHSGYQTLNSNGRLEADFLDQLSDQLSGAHPSAATPAAASKTPAKPKTTEPVPSAPLPQRADDPSLFSSSKELAPDTRSALQAARRPTVEEDPQLVAEAKEFSDILKSQTHPVNLVAVKKGATPVFSTPDLNAKPLFYASQHDEFEILDFNVDWIHVRISGLSRGWIWRNSVEMPDNFAASDQPQATEVPRPFHVTREETVPFPGDWSPLRSKIVRVLTVQKIDENAVDSSPEVKRDYAKTLFDKTYTEISKGTQEIAGVVLVFDSVDGGMIAATTDSLKQWESGALTDSALWHQCFFDPPEIFDATTPAASH